MCLQGPWQVVVIPIWSRTGVLRQAASTAYLDADKVVRRNNIIDLQKTSFAVEGQANLHSLVDRYSTKSAASNVVHLHPCTKARGMSHISIFKSLDCINAAVIGVGAEPGLE